MYIIVWEFRVKPEHTRTFQAAYGPTGAWVRFFRQDPHYLGTELLCDASDEHRYLTVDRWTARAAYEAFRADRSEEYRALDASFEALTEQETLIGAFGLITE